MDRLKKSKIFYSLIVFLLVIFLIYSLIRGHVPVDNSFSLMFFLATLLIAILSFSLVYSYNNKIKEREKNKKIK